MRTTLTLDDDVAERLASETRRTKSSYRAVVNSALRRGLDAMPTDLPPYTIDAKDMGLRSGVELDDVEGLLDHLERGTRR